MTASTSVAIDGQTFSREECDRAIDAVWPYDGPHDRDSLIAAARALHQLVRYLNNGTQHRPEFAATTYFLLTGVESALVSTHQLFQQLSRHLDEQADTTHGHRDYPLPGDLYTVEDRDNPDAAVRAASSAANHMTAARRHLADVTDELGKAVLALGSLGNRPDEATDRGGVSP